MNTVKDLARIAIQNAMRHSNGIGLASVDVDPILTNGIGNIEMIIKESLVNKDDLTVQIRLKLTSEANDFAAKVMPNTELNGSVVDYFQQDFDNFMIIQSWWNMNYAKFATIKFNR